MKKVIKKTADWWVSLIQLVVNVVMYIVKTKDDGKGDRENNKNV